MIFMCIQPWMYCQEDSTISRWAQRQFGQWMGRICNEVSFTLVRENAPRMTRKLYPECDAVGTITLNGSVGGNQSCSCGDGKDALVRSLSGFQPVIQHMSKILHLRRSESDKKLPYWAQVVLQMREEGIDNPVIRVVGEDGRLTEATHQVLEVIAGHQMILATSHLSHEETFALVKAAKEHRVEHIIITHVDFPNHILYGGRTIRTAAQGCLYGTLFCYIQFWKSRL